MTLACVMILGFIYVAQKVSFWLIDLNEWLVSEKPFGHSFWVNLMDAVNFILVLWNFALILILYTFPLVHVLGVIFGKMPMEWSDYSQNKWLVRLVSGLIVLSFCLAHYHMSAFIWA